MSNNSISGSFVLAGLSPSYFSRRVTRTDVKGGDFNIWLKTTAFVGTVRLERSPDNGVTWYPYSNGTQQGYTFTFGASDPNLSLPISESEAYVQYRLNCTVRTSGTLNYTIGGPD